MKGAGRGEEGTCSSWHDARKSAAVARCVRGCWPRHVTGRRQRLQYMRAAGSQREGSRAAIALRSSASCCRRLPPPAREKGRTAARRRKASAAAACFASQLSCVAARAALARHWHKQRRSGSLMSHVTCHASRASRHPSRQRQRLFALQHARGGVSLSSAFPQQHVTIIIPSRRHFRSIAAEIAERVPHMS